MAESHRGHIGVAESDKSYYVGFWKKDADQHPLGERLVGREPKVVGRLALKGVTIDGVAIQNGKVMALRIPKDSVMRNADAATTENVFRDITLNVVSECITGRNAGNTPLIERIDGANIDSKFTSFESLQQLLEDSGQLGD